LFSLEPWGETQKLERLHGYTLGQFDLTNSDATLRIWPRKAEKVRGGGWSIGLDQQGFTLPKGEQATTPVPVERLRKTAQMHPARGGAKRKQGAAESMQSSNRRYAALVGPSDFPDMHFMMDEWIASNTKSDRKVLIRNIALDMEYTWGFIRDRIMSRQWEKGIQWQSLMIDWTSEEIKRIAGSISVSAETAKSRESDIRNFVDKKKDVMLGNRIDFQCRAYLSEPFMHGFLLDDRILFVSLCSFDDGKMASSPYLQFLKNAGPDYELDERVAEYFIAVFASWFDRRWTAARPVVTPVETA
jgi:hypothetical protein